MNNKRIEEMVEEPEVGLEEVEVDVEVDVEEVDGIES